MKINSLRNEVKTLSKSLQSKSFGLYQKILLQLCQDYAHLGYPNSIASLVKAKDWDGLVEFADSLSAQCYADATQHFVANQFAALVRKYPFPYEVTNFTPEETAYAKFMLAEHRMKLINRRFRLRRKPCRRSLPFSNELERMINFINYVLGSMPDLNRVWARCGFGPGASLGIHGSATNIGRKLLSDRWTVSTGARDYAFAALMNHAQFREVLLPDHCGFSSGQPDLLTEQAKYSEKIAYVEHNKISFVPKTVKTHRSIAVEPLLNSYVQKGIDEYMRLALKRIGIDLSDQSGNQRLAREGSLDQEDGYVTIDLSSASDSISLEVVRTLLPPDWFYLLDSTRSKSFLYRNVVTRYEKFCSMGNGFSFPLETLMFVAACHAVGAGSPGKDFLVYGDDIIVRKQFARPLIELLLYLGFRTNNDKTFLSGPFRESCGADWFSGEDVRPFTLDFELDSLSSLFKFLNLSLRNSRSAMFFEGVRHMVLGRIPKRLQFWRPYSGNPDSGIDSTGDEHLYSPNVRFCKKLYAWRCIELQSVSIEDSIDLTVESGPAALVFGALSGSASAAPFTVRRKTRTKVRFTTYSGSHSLWLPAARPFGRSSYPD